MEAGDLGGAGLAPTVTLDVWRLPAAAVPRAALATLTLARHLRAGGDVGFAKVLGTGDDTFVPRGTELTRWAALVVWRSPAVVRRLHPPWTRRAVCSWRALLAPLASKGAWSGRKPFELPTASAAREWQGPVVSLTHARLRARGTARFLRSVPDVARELSGRVGLDAAFAVGESPVGVQGTVSVWRDDAAVRDFAWRTVAHRAVVERTPRERWYAEELFARFALIEGSGDLRTLARP